MSDYDVFLQKAGEFHGGICAGIALGTRITLAALRHLGLDPHQKIRKKLIVFLEIDRCMADAIQAITGCSLGRRSLKHMNYGKFAATFVNLETGAAVRGTVMKVFSSDNTDDTLREIAALTDEELVTLQPVRVNIPENDMPGPPRQKEICSSCGERVVDGRHVKRGEAVICRGCLDGAYYRPHKETL